MSLIETSVPLNLSKSVETLVSVLIKLDSPMFNKSYYTNIPVSQLVKLIHNPLSLVNPFRRLLMKYDDQTRYLNVFQVVKPNDKCKVYIKLNNVVVKNLVNIQEVINQFREFVTLSEPIQLENYNVISNYINTIVIFDSYYTNVTTVYSLVTSFIKHKNYNRNIFDLTIYPLVLSNQSESVIIPLVNQSETKNNNEYRYHLKFQSLSQTKSNNTILPLNEFSCFITYTDNCKSLDIDLNKVSTIISTSLINKTIIPTVDDDIITNLISTIREVIVVEDYEDELIMYLNNYYDKHQTYTGCKYDIQLIKHILTSILLG